MLDHCITYPSGSIPPTLEYFDYISHDLQTQVVLFVCCLYHLVLHLEIWVKLYYWPTHMNRCSARDYS